MSSPFPPPANPLPPPPPPSGQRSSPLPDGWDWERVRQLAVYWYRPLLEREPWMAALYLVLGACSGVGFFLAVNIVGWSTIGLMFVGVGVFLIRPFFAMVDRLARAECSMAGLVGTPIEPRPTSPARGLVGWAAVADPQRWRQVGYLLLNLVLSLTLANVGLAAFWLVPRLVFEDPFVSGFSLFDISPLAWVVGIGVGALMLGAAPRIAIYVARFKVQVTTWFLGPDRLAAAQQRAELLTTQRRDVLDAVASERRRIERNLHDGVQQQLVAIGLDLGMAEQHLGADPERARELIVSARQKVQGSIGELRQLGRGLHPAILEDRGLDAALSAVVANATVPTSVHVDPDLDLPTDVAETVYFVVNEAVTNVMKHARARVASVHVGKVAANVRIVVHDDGVGGVDAGRGTGIAGIRARVNAVDGSLAIVSPVGGPTTLTAEIPRHARPAPTRE